MSKAERLIVYPVLALLVLAVFGDFGTSRTAQADDKDKVGRFTKIETEQLVVVRKDGSTAAAILSTEDGDAVYILDAEGRDAAEISARDGFGFVGLWAPPIEGARIELFADSHGGHKKYPAHIRVLGGALYVGNKDKSAESLVLPGFVETRNSGARRRFPGNR